MVLVSTWETESQLGHRRAISNLKARMCHVSYEDRVLHSPTHDGFKPVSQCARGGFWDFSKSKTDIRLRHQRKSRELAVLLCFIFCLVLASCLPQPLSIYQKFWATRVSCLMSGIQGIVSTTLETTDYT